MTTTSIVTVSTDTQQLYHDVTQSAPYATLRYMFTHAGYYCDLLSKNGHWGDLWRKRGGKGGKRKEKEGKREGKEGGKGKEKGGKSL